MRKKQALQLDGRYSIMIENAFYYCNPPENKQIEKKVRSPIHEYIKKLLYKDLNKLCVEKVNKLERFYLTTLVCDRFCKHYIRLYDFV